jgi:hypothetical protein
MGRALHFTPTEGEEAGLNTFAKTILGRVSDRNGTAGDLARLPAVYRKSGGGFMNRIATAGIMRLAFRWPVFTMIVVLTVIGARIMSAGRHDAGSPPR